MEQLSFTTRVLGHEAVEKLKRGEVTQTLRSRHSNIVQAALLGGLHTGDSLKIFLNGEYLGEAEYQCMTLAMMSSLSPEDARLGGFSSLDELRKALFRAGFRFKANYRLYRVSFSLFEESYQAALVRNKRRR